MKNLVNILKPFYKTIEKLNGFEYITIFYIILFILTLIKNIASSINHSDNDKLSKVNFETDDQAFDNNIEFLNAKEKKEKSSKK